MRYDQEPDPEAFRRVKAEYSSAGRTSHPEYIKICKWLEEHERKQKEKQCR